MSTLVVCLDRSDDVARAAGVETPVVGWEAVRSLAVDVGLADPEETNVNCLLEALRVTRELREDGDEAVVAVVSGGGSESVVGADRSVAAQVDALLEEHGLTSAVVVVDSAEDERLVPIIESRVPVDSVDRVVVRQARDLESTYYLLKQFLADEELRQTTLVPIGVALLVFPALMTYASPVIAIASITGVIGLFLLYKGLGVDAYVAALPGRIKSALYSGQVSVVTYVVAAGLALIGVFAGALGVSAIEGSDGVLIPAMGFAYEGVPWLAMAALAASAGRLLDEAIRDEPVPAPYLNLPFGVVAVGIVVRGFSGYFLQRSGALDSTTVPRIDVGVVSVEAFRLTAGQRLAVYVFAGVVVSLIGVRTAAYFGGTAAEAEETETGVGE